MFFFFSKILGYLTQPAVIILLIIIAAFLIRKPIWKKRLYYTAAALFILFTNPLLINFLLNKWELPTVPYTQLPNYKVGVVLTGITVTKSPAPADRVYFNYSSDRLMHAYELYKLGKIEKILISGGDGSLTNRDYKEAKELSHFLFRIGMNENDVIIDTIADNTYENAVESVKILKQINIPQEQTLLITSGMHMRRALACFRKQNYDTPYFTCDFKSRTYSLTPDSWLVPSVEAMHNWQRLLKEWVGFVAYKLAGYC
jgi:uncharacterized SAM-binding protein YcdF (DUF218 family)